MIVQLCFHGIGQCGREREPGESRYWVARDDFLHILDAVRDIDHVRLSFDDGNKSDAEVALGALRERGMDATFFALAGRLEDPASLSETDLQDLRAAGMRVGSHGWAHVPWCGLEATELRRELDLARTRLAEASRGPVDEAALPLGRYDRRLITQLRSRGYRHVYTSDRAPSSADAWLQPRYSVTATDTPQSVLDLTRPHLGPAYAGRRLKMLVKRLR